jgi:hypothetical protein
MRGSKANFLHDGGFAEFDKVCRGLLAVPKTELVEQIEVREKRKRRKGK